MALRISRHAIERYFERVERLSEREICARLSTPAVELAAAFGAPFVRLATGQRIVLQGDAVVTVLPVEHPQGRLDPRIAR